MPFQPSYEDRPGAPDRVFASVGDDEYERLVEVWVDALERAGAARAELLHLHHLTPANEAARRAFPALPVVGQLHGTELAMLRRLEAGAPAELAVRGALAAADARLGGRLRAADRPARRRRRRRAVCSESRTGRSSSCRAGSSSTSSSAGRSSASGGLPTGGAGWSSSRSAGTRAASPAASPTRDADLWPLREAEAILLYVGRYTAVKRLPLLIRAHAQALARLERPLPLVLVGGSPGEWEGEHPLTAARAAGDEQVFLAGWRPHQQLPEALNAADLLVLPSVAEAFGLVLVEAMACGLPVLAADAHGPAQIVAPGTGWLVPADDQHALTEALLRAASDPQQRRQRGERAHRHSRSNYGWPMIAARIADIYDQVSGGLDAQRAARA